MYSIDDPAGSSIHSGGAAQVLGFQERYLCQRFPDLRGFWAWRGSLGLGHGCCSGGQHPRYLEADEFQARVPWGYQATTHHHQGRLRDDATGFILAWNYTVTPDYGWGGRDQVPRPTAGWLSYLPIFEPGWQVLMAHGRATGWLDWGGDRHDFREAPVYSEKNWGGAFPQRWFWIQCNAFEDDPDLTVTVAGGRRQVLNRLETVGLVGIHRRGQFIEWLSLRDDLTWQVQPWGDWRVSAQNHRYRVEIHGCCDRPAATVRVPTRDGLQFRCWDTTHGALTLRLRSQPAAPSPLHVEAHSRLAGLEVGGEGWDRPWCYGRGG
jgi:tocopherol cyclase